MRIECIYEKGVLIPLKKFEYSRAIKSSFKYSDDLKLHGYLKLLKEGEGAEELFEL